MSSAFFRFAAIAMSTRCNKSAMSYLTQSDAARIDKDLMDEYRFGLLQLMELAGLGCAHAFAKIYPKDSLPKSAGAILIACGPGNNGGDGLVCARHLKIVGYRPTIFYPRMGAADIFASLKVQCEKMDIPFLSYLPSDVSLIRDAYNVIVDALFGFSFRPPVREEYVAVLASLIKSGLPICSIDIPSGWHIEDGPPPPDSNPPPMRPDSLISLTAPKLCAKHFSGRAHLLAGRFVPPDLAKKYELRIAVYPNSDLCVDIGSGSAAAAADELPKPGSSFDEVYFGDGK